MKRGMLFFGVALLIVLGVNEDRRDAIPYYVQLIRAGDDPLPPTPGCKAAGPKLSAALQSPIQWKHIWRITQRQVALCRCQAAKLSLGNGYQLEVERTGHNQRKVSVFHHGTLADRIISPMGEAMTLIGEAQEPHRAVFIVVRRDPPGS